MGHYRSCREGAGSYVGVYFNAVGEDDPAGAGYALPGALAFGVHSFEKMVRSEKL